MVSRATTESALLLAGFALAHAAWSISDAPDLLVPLAIVERSGQRELMRFEAGTQQEAITRGKAHMHALTGEYDDWAFAREGLQNEHGRKTDVISVDIGVKGKCSTSHRHSAVRAIRRTPPFHAHRRS